jgi:putative protease
MQQYEESYSRSNRQQFVGEVIADDQGRVMIDVKNKFEIGDELELMTPSGNHAFKLESLQDKKGAAIDIAPGSGHIVEIPNLPDEAKNYGLLMRTI